MYYLFKTFLGSQNHYAVASETERTLWCVTAAEAYEDWVCRNVKDLSKYNLSYHLENYTLVSSSKDITTLFYSCPELLL